MVTGYNIIDSQTGEKVAFAKTRKGATRAVDRRDNEYGGYRYTAQPVVEQTPPMTPDRVKKTGRQFGQKIGSKEAKLIAAVLKGAK